MKYILICTAIILSATFAPAARTISPQENAACRSDAIRNCFFNLGSGEATRACLRRNVETLSPICKALVTKRMTAKYSDFEPNDLSYD
jgi:hypothetical protein